MWTYLYFFNLVSKYYNFHENNHSQIISVLNDHTTKDKKGQFQDGMEFYETIFSKYFNKYQLPNNYMIIKIQ
jgi:hypothetical protein